jgi:type IV secretory pathway TrbL component
MFTRKWPYTMLSMMLLVFLGVMAPPASSDVVSGGPTVGQ